MSALYYVFTDQTKANALPPIVDARQGYPKAGVNVGGGIHVTPTFVTQTYAQVLANPTTGTSWAYPADAVVVPVVGPSAITLGLPAPAALDATWTPSAVA